MVNVFLTGASGFVGSHVTPVLLAAGHKLTALARSDASAKKLKDQGVTVIRGTLEDTEVLEKAAAASDGVIHLGFIHDFTNMPYAIKVELAAIEAFGKGLKGTNKPLIITSGLIGSSPAPTELTPALTTGRGQAEHFVLALASSGIRSQVIRLPPTTHGDSDQGFLTFYIQHSKKAGFAGYLGDVENHWPAVHVKDAAELYKLALENATGSLKGGRWRSFQKIASVVAKHLGISTKSLTPQEAETAYLWMGHIISMDAVATSELTRERTGWEPKEKALLKDIEESEWYFAEGSAPKSCLGELGLQAMWAMVICTGQRYTSMTLEIQDSGVPPKSIAETVARRLGIPTKSLMMEEAIEHYVWFAQVFLTRDMVASRELTKSWLDWAPEAKGLLEDIKGSEWYFSPEAVSMF
ncbi:hypothetical protein L202_01772 [Cryptococcus amylolentus CBS 6039]|uniref:NmrA-like domain-containing protein n=1 Tax=Cryptococcus amylolentus CBS 6039 TaxID=1295533 RepID=A0A1E3I768_9TREE|nr:hypothetical protein L202_01772 [Cryptococcus amylolentus CBS 6039]ODN83676.1 hypothetical protein L202_01772 [Cryptococcus amylolentus CBS 6039]